MWVETFYFCLFVCFLTKRLPEASFPNLWEKLTWSSCLKYHLETFNFILKKDRWDVWEPFFHRRPIKHFSQYLQNFGGFPGKKNRIFSHYINFYGVTKLWLINDITLNCSDLDMFIVTIPEKDRHNRYTFKNIQLWMVLHLYLI